MHTTEEILQILHSSDEKLNEILEACDWTGKTEFTEEQVEILISVQAIKEEDSDSSYLGAFFQTIGLKHGVEKAQINEIYDAINAIGGGLITYRDRFEEICQQVKDGVSPAEAIAPPQPVIEDTPPVIEAEADPESIQMEKFIAEQANAAIVVTISQIKGFADMAYEEQERLKNLFMTKYRKGLAKELLSPEFKTEFMQRMTASLEGKGEEKKSEELTGVQNPMPLLSSSS